MATNTTNLKLVKPSGNENADVSVINGNMDLIDTAVSKKVDKVSGKGLSANDYTTSEKNKVANVPSNTTSEIASINSVLATKEPKHASVTGTLSSGATSIVLSNSAITTTSTIDIYTDTFGVNPTDVTVSSGSVTLTFDAQSGAVNVKVVIS